VSLAFKQYEHQQREVNQLLAFHGELHELRANAAPSGRGRRASELGVLHKSAVVLLTACWESYIENILKECIGIIAQGLPDPFLLPEVLRKAIASTKTSKLSINSKNELYPWYFAGEGWRSLLLEFGELKIEELNTPNSEGVRELVRSILGIDDITTSWSRPGMNAKGAADRLDEYLSDRHAVAHGAALDRKFSKSYIENYLNFLDQTVWKTEKAIRNHLKRLSLDFQ
jgi:hypothetical protein